MELKIKKIKKAYGNHDVLKGISASLGEGIHGFLGANGVGKSTLFNILTGYIKDYDGEIVFPDYDETKEALIGTLPQRFIGYPEMTVYEFMEYMGKIKIKGIPSNYLSRDINEKLKIFGLLEFKNKKLKKLSGGQLRRLGIAQAFQLNPKIVFLDEPTTGLDPSERVKFKNYIADAAQKQIILLSTHIVSDLEYISRDIYILKNGKYVAHGNEEDLVNSCLNIVWEKQFNNEEEMFREIDKNRISMIYNSSDGIKARFISEEMLPGAQHVKPSLNDVYISYFC